MAWQKVAEGTNLWDLESTVGEMNLPKGSQIKVEMNLKMPLGWIFDVAGAELIFKPFTPDGVELVDVYGEGSKGYIMMEADPAWLLAVLAFIKAHWLAIIIAGFVITAIIASIIVLVKVSVMPPFTTVLLILGVVAIVAFVVRGRKDKG